jgi:hypothetical protein
MIPPLLPDPPPEPLPEPPLELNPPLPDEPPHAGANAASPRADDTRTKAEAVESLFIEWSLQKRDVSAA